MLERRSNIQDLRLLAKRVAKPARGSKTIAIGGWAGSSADEMAGKEKKVVTFGGKKSAKTLGSKMTKCRDRRGRETGC